MSKITTSKNDVGILFTYFLILSTLFILCGQVVNKLSSVDKFIVFSIFDNSLFYKGLWGYLPQHCLYFLPEPQVRPFSVYMILWNIYSIIYFSRKNESERYWYYVIHIVYIELYIFLFLHTNCTHCYHQHLFST